MSRTAAAYPSGFKKLCKRKAGKLRENYTRHSMIRLPSAKDARKNLKSSQEKKKRHTAPEGTKIRLTLDFSAEVMEVRG